MKRLLFVGLLIVSFVFVGAGSAFAGSVLDEIMAAGVIKVSTDANYAPQSFLNDKGELEGFDISVAKEVAKRLGVKVKFITPDWDLITSGNWGKRWDLSIGSMTPTVERTKALHFTMPYYSTPAQFAVHKSNTTIKSLKDLAGKHIGVATETTYDRYLNNDLELVGTKIKFQDWKAGKITTYPTDANTIEDLALGDGVRLDAIITAKNVIFEAAKSGCGKGCPIKMLGDPVFYEHLSFALDKSRPNSESLLKKLNEILASMYKDGTLVDLSEQFYGVSLIPEL
ncbi:MAG: cysteine ABC transporter substrate-binding protein [Deltaproteobacteria bacterium]|nr:MAG: cysteine ABC transporter substrate-binding protein [Deltaproteobacteria bacterium]RLC16631.1 MAG: cysteine ABC transporter substrate-binding protein [Deltaproteobacteria bacterium]